MTITFDDKLGSRGLTHMNLLVATVGEQQLIFEFQGQNIPGAVTIASTRSERNGKWSFTEWTVELSENIRSFVWKQDWNECVYVTAGTWDRLVADIRQISGIPDLSNDAIERFVRAKLGKAARKLDEARDNATADNSPILAELLAAQQELAEAQRQRADAQAEHTALVAEVQQAIEAKAAAERARTEAKETAERVAKAKSAMAKGASLADLQSLLAA